MCEKFQRNDCSILLYVAQKDYNSRSLNVTFGPDELEKSVRVPIINDPSREGSEKFFGNLGISDQPGLLGLVLPTTDVAVIEILYNDCK